MECTDRANVYAKRLEIRNVREIEAERDPARQIIASGQKQPRDTDDIIGALHRDICAINAIQPALIRLMMTTVELSAADVVGCASTLILLQLAPSSLRIDISNRGG